MKNNTIKCKNLLISNKKPLTLIAGPCQLESEQHAIEMVRKIKNAGSTEFNKKCFPVIGLMNEWIKDGKLLKGTRDELGGTMRLGSYVANLRQNSIIKDIYKSSVINERHRHRYEVNISLMSKFENKGMIFSGLSQYKKIPEIIELKKHKWFIGVQFHPEFKSRPLFPHPLFSSFIKASKYK